MRKRMYTYIISLLVMFMMLSPLHTEAAERGLPRLTDRADLLSDDEEAKLNEKLDKISEERDCDIVIVTAESLEGKTPRAYADDFYDQNGYGMGAENSGILLLVCMEERDWAISTCGYGITAFTDAGQEYMAEQFLPDLSAGEYAGAFHKFADLCENFIAQADSGKPYDVGNLPKESTRGYIPVWIIGSFFFGFLIAFVMAQIKKSKLKTIRSNETARGYEKDGSMQFTQREDIFVGQQVFKRKIEKESGGGGSSTHKSSSGVRHGGSSGKF